MFTKSLIYVHTYNGTPKNDLIGINLSARSLSWQDVFNGKFKFIINQTSITRIVLLLGFTTSNGSFLKIKINKLRKSNYDVDIFKKIPQ